MSDRVHSFIVVLDRNFRADDAAATCAAIAQLRGVIDVVPNVADFQFAVAASRAKQAVREAVDEALDNLETRRDG